MVLRKTMVKFKVIRKMAVIGENLLYRVGFDPTLKSYSIRVGFLNPTL